MKINDLLDLKEQIETSVNLTRGLDVSYLDSKEDCLETQPEKFFQVTYPSQLIEEIIDIINIRMMKNKLQLKSGEQDITILAGGPGSGKTHALLAVYNLFNQTNLTMDWLSEHEIEINKFNVSKIKNKSKSCLVSPAAEGKDKIWELIFKQLGKENLLTNVDGVPDLPTLQKLVAEEPTAIFIDDLERFLSRLRQEGETELLAKNKSFLLSLLQTVIMNDNLTMLIGMLWADEEFKKIFTEKEVMVKQVEPAAQRKKFIFYRLFQKQNSKQLRNQIKQPVDLYLEQYDKLNIDLKTGADRREEFLAAYPFHPELLEVLKNIQQNNPQQFKKSGPTLKILVGLFNNKAQTRDLFLVSDLEIDFLAEIMPHLLNSLRQGLKQCTGRQAEKRRRILKTVFFYTVAADKQGITEEEIIALISTPDAENSIVSLRQELTKLKKQVTCLQESNSLYYLEPKQDIFSLVEQRKGKITKQAAQEQLKKYICKEVLPFECYVYGEEQWLDNPQLEAILLEEKWKGKQELASFLNQQLYTNCEYQNTLLPIVPQENIFTNKYIHKMKRILALRRIKEEIETEVEVEEVLQELNQLEADLTELLISNFGNYFYWVPVEGQLELTQGTFNPKEDKALADIVTDKFLLQDYILAKDEQVIAVDQLLRDSRKCRELPFIPDRNFLQETLSELSSNQSVFLNQKTNRIYKSMSALIEERTLEISTEEAKQKLISYLRNDLFSPNYKIYGVDQLQDSPRLEYVLLVDDLPSDNQLSDFVEQNIYAERQFKNNLVLVQANKNIFREQNILQAKQIIGLENLTEEVIKQDQIIDILEQKKEKVITKLQNCFGSYLSWQGSDEELKLETIDLARADCDSVEEIIKTDLAQLKEYIRQEVSKERKGIKIKDLLLRCKQDRTAPIVSSRDVFATAVKELKQGETIFVAEEGTKVYPQFLVTVAQKMKQINDEEVVKALGHFMRSNLFKNQFRIWGIDQIGDDQKLKYVLLLEDLASREELKKFLLNKIYTDRKFENNLVIIKPEVDLFTDKILTKVKKIMGLQRISDENRTGYFEQVLKELTQELKASLKKDFDYYFLRWSEADGKLEIEPEEVDPMHKLGKQVEVDRSKLKEDIITRVKNAPRGVAVTDLLADYRRFRSYPVITGQTFYRLIEDLKASQELISIQDRDKVYANTTSLIKGISETVDEKQAKEELVYLIRDELVAEDCKVYGYDQIKDDSQVKYVLLLEEFQQLNELKNFLAEEIYAGREFKNNLVIIRPKDNVFVDKYLSKVKIIIGFSQIVDKISWDPKKIKLVKERQKKKLFQGLKNTFGYYLCLQELGEERKLYEKEIIIDDLTQELRIDIVGLKEDIVNRLQQTGKRSPQELLLDYKRFTRYPLIIDDQLFEQAIEELKQDNKVFVDPDIGKLKLNKKIVEANSQETAKERKQQTEESVSEIVQAEKSDQDKELKTEKTEAEIDEMLDLFS